MFTNFVKTTSQTIQKNQNNKAENITAQWSRYGIISIIDKNNQENKYQFWKGNEPQDKQEGVKYIEITDLNSLKEQLKNLGLCTDQNVDLIAKTTFPDAVLDTLMTYNDNISVHDNRTIKFTQNEDGTITLEQELTITDLNIQITADDGDIRQVKLKTTTPLKIKAKALVKDDASIEPEVKIFSGKNDITNLEKDNSKTIKVLSVESQYKVRRGVQTGDILSTTTVEGIHLLLSNDFEQVKANLHKTITEKLKNTLVKGGLANEEALLDAMQEEAKNKENHTSFTIITEDEKQQAKQAPINSRDNPRPQSPNFTAPVGDALRAGVNLADIVTEGANAVQEAINANGKSSTGPSTPNDSGYESSSESSAYATPTGGATEKNTSTLLAQASKKLSRHKVEEAPITSGPANEEALLDAMQEEAKNEENHTSFTTEEIKAAQQAPINSGDNPEQHTPNFTAPLGDALRAGINLADKTVNLVTEGFNAVQQAMNANGKSSTGPSTPNDSGYDSSYKNSSYATPTEGVAGSNTNEVLAGASEKLSFLTTIEEDGFVMVNLQEDPKTNTTEENPPKPTKWSTKKKAIVGSATVLDILAAAAFTTILLEQFNFIRNNIISLSKGFSNTFTIIGLSTIGASIVAFTTIAIGVGCSTKLDEVVQDPNKDPSLSV